MSGENLAVVRAAYERWRRGDFSSTDWAHAGIEYVIADGPSPGRYRGWEEMAAAWRGFLDAWEGLVADRVDDYIELDRDRVLVLHLFTARGKASGLDLGPGAEVATLFQLEDGKVARLVLYFDRRRAFDELGLGSEPEQAGG